MSELKYLSDGRKVSVIGKINKTEYIVQEVFITKNGDEIPSGENFTAKSLHDSPVLSWKEKEAEKAESRYEKANSEIKAIEKELKLMKGQRQGHVDILKQNEKLTSLLDSCNIDNLADILMGNIKYVVEPCSWSFKVQSFEDGVFAWDNYYNDSRYEGLKMVSLFALKSSPCHSDRKCKVEVSRYTDGSGGGKKFEFFKGDKELSVFIHELIETNHKDGKLTISIINEASKYITVPQCYIDEIKEKNISAAKERFNKSQEENKKMLDKTLKELE